MDLGGQSRMPMEKRPDNHGYAWTATSMDSGALGGCTIRHFSCARPPRQPCARGGHSSTAEPLPSKQKTRVRFSLPAPISPRSSSGRGHRSFKSDGAGSNPARGTNCVVPLRLAGRAPGFELGGLGSNPRGAATSNRHRGIAQSVERRSHTPRQPQVRSLLPRPVFRRLSQMGRQRVVAPS